MTDASPLILSFTRIAAVVAVAATMLLAPALVRAEDKEGWTSLFDGKTLDGWKANEKPEQWKVVDGAIVAHGDRSHLFYVGKDEKNPPSWKDFHFRCEVMTKKGSNSGIFFHTKWQNDGWPSVGYEAQVNNSQGDPVRTGSLYNVVKEFKAWADDDKWFTEEIMVKGKHITIKVNDKTVVDYEEDPKDIAGDRKLSQGTFAIQAHDPGSTVMFRAIEVKELK